jgi:hypothetical protein
MIHGCATQGRGRAKAACVVCNTRNGCASCVAEDVECEHWLQCKGRLGFYHMECEDVGDDDDDGGDEWDFVCRCLVSCQSTQLQCQHDFRQMASFVQVRRHLAR